MRVTQTSRAGLYTGTFDPPTRSHIQIMTDVVRKKGFAKLIVLVNQDGSGKAYRCSARQRAAMIRAGLPADIAGHVEVRIEPKMGKNVLFKQLRRAGNYDWVGVIGHDSFTMLTPTVRSSRRWLVVDRNGKSAAGSPNVEHMSIGALGSEISSGKARALFAAGKDASTLLRPGTMRIIRRSGYYVTPTQAVLQARQAHFNALLAGAEAALAPPFIAQQAPEEHASYIARYRHGRVTQT